MMNACATPSLHSFRACESLIETIVSITIIVIGAAAALVDAAQLFTGNELVGTKEIAIQLALEGLDALKTHAPILLFAGTDDCWNHFGLRILPIARVSSSDEILTEGETYYFARDWAGGAAPGWDILPVSDQPRLRRFIQRRFGRDGNEDVEPLRTNKQLRCTTDGLGNPRILSHREHCVFRHWRLLRRHGHCDMERTRQLTFYSIHSNPRACLLMFQKNRRLSP
jgi:hypothetical protein